MSSALPLRTDVGLARPKTLRGSNVKECRAGGVRFSTQKTDNPGAVGGIQLRDTGGERKAMLLPSNINAGLRFKIGLFPGRLQDFLNG